MNLADTMLYKGSLTQKTAYSVLQQDVQGHTRPIHGGGTQHSGDLGWEALLFWASTETEFHKCYRMIPGDTSQAAYSNSSSWLPHPSPPLSADSESVLLYILTRYSYLFFYNRIC